MRRPLDVEMRLRAMKAFRAIADAKAAANLAKVIREEIAVNPKTAGDAGTRGSHIKTGSVEGTTRPFDYTINYTYRFGDERVVIDLLTVV